MRIDPNNTAVLVVDYQEKLLPAIHDVEHLLERTQILLSGLQVLEIPVVLTEQYAKGLGPTVKEIRDCLGENYHPYDKMTFSVMGCEAVKESFAALGKKNIIVCGTEAHICVLQSVIDLLAEGYNVYLVEDCIASRKPSDKESGIKRAMGEGALITSAEAILFELTVISGTPTFKQISKIVK